MAYESLRRWDDAADAFEHARDADDHKSDTDSLLHLGHCYTKLGRWPQSKTTYEEVLKIDPNNDVAKRTLFWVIKQQPPN